MGFGTKLACRLKKVDTFAVSFVSNESFPKREMKHSKRAAVGKAGDFAGSGKQPRLSRLVSCTYSDVTANDFRKKDRPASRTIHLFRCSNVMSKDDGDQDSTRCQD